MHSETKKQRPMSEEKKDIEQSTDMAAEPVGAAMRADVSTLGYDIDNWPGMPLVGPSNLEEMNAREPWDWSLSHNISGKHQTISFDPLGEFSRDSAIKMLAFLCVRCSKIWKILIFSLTLHPKRY